MLDTPEAVKSFLSQQYACVNIASVVPLSGGFVNFVFRVEFIEPISLSVSDGIFMKEDRKVKVEKASRKKGCLIIISSRGRDNRKGVN
jgi:hypothetical protein